MKVSEILSTGPEYLDEVFVTPDGTGFKLLQEGKWISGRFDANIRIDKPTHLHGQGQSHAHVLGRRKDELGVVNFDGTASHGAQFKLHDRDADSLRPIGFTIRPDNLVEWMFLGPAPKLLLG